MNYLFWRRLESGDLLAKNEAAASFPDAFPLSPGHTLIIPRRHEPDFLALSAEERDAVWRLLDVVHRHLDDTFHPAG